MADTVRELVIKVSVEADTDDLKKVEQDQEAARTKSTALGTALGGLALKLADVAVQAAAAGLALAKDLVFGTAAAGDEIAKTAGKLKIATDDLQRYRGAAQLAGAETKDFDNGIADLRKNLGEAIDKGTGPAVEALGTLGLEVAEVDALLSEGDLGGTLGLISDAVVQVGDDSRTSAALTKLLGGSGKELGVFFAQGAEGIQAAADAISETGSVIDRDALGSFEAMQDSQLLLEKRVEAAKNTIAIGLAPAVTEIGDRVSEWLDENDKVISQDLPVVLEGIANAAITLVTATLELISSWREFGRDVSSLVEVMTEDLDPVLGSTEGAFSQIEAAISGASLAVLDLVDSFLEAVGAGEELRQIFKEIRGDIAGDSGPKGERGAPGFLGGGSSLVNPNDVKGADSSGDTTKLKAIAADPKFSDADRARVGAEAARIDQREAAKAQAAAEKESARRAGNVQASRNRARAAQRQQRRAIAKAAPRTGGKKQPTVEELIGQVSGASSSALRSASSALSGTLVVNQITNNNFTNTVDVGGVRVSAAVAEVGPEVEAAITGTVGTALDRQNREAVQLIEARNNVGFG